MSEECALCFEEAEWLMPTPCCGTDATTTRFGIREVAIKHGQFLLNGKPLFISGYQSNFQYGEHEYGFPDLEHYKKRLMVAKEMGFNAVR